MAASGPPPPPYPYNPPPPPPGAPPSAAGSKPFDPKTTAYILAGCALAILIGVFTKSWMTGRGGLSGVGPLGIEVCFGSTCQGRGWDGAPGDVQLIAYLALFAGIAAAGASAYMAFLVLSNAPNKFPAFKIINGVLGVAAFATTFFAVRLLIEGQEMSISWSPVLGIGGVVAAGIFIRKLRPYWPGQGTTPWPAPVKPLAQPGGYGAPYGAPQGQAYGAPQGQPYGAPQGAPPGGPPGAPGWAPPSGPPGAQGYGAPQGAPPSGPPGAPGYGAPQGAPPGGPPGAPGWAPPSGPPGAPAYGAPQGAPPSGPPGAPAYGAPQGAPPSGPPGAPAYGAPQGAPSGPPYGHGAPPMGPPQAPPPSRPPLGGLDGAQPAAPQSKATIMGAAAPQLAALLKQPAAPQAQGGAPAGSQFCGRCGKPMTFVAQYQRWFCEGCQQYA